MNILLYVIDALRADHVSIYGYDRETTPNIDSLGKDGIIYNYCFAPSTWTRSVAASILTSTYPRVHGVLTHEDLFTADLRTLPDALSKTERTILGFNANANISSAAGFGDGFDRYEDLYKNDEIIAQRGYKGERDQEGNEVSIPRSSDLTDRIIASVDGASEEFFIYAWSVDPHSPYSPPPEFNIFGGSFNGDMDGSLESIHSAQTKQDIQRLIDLYDGEVRYNDYHFGRVLDELRERELYEETLIIVVGDHGESFGEHGYFEHGNPPFEEQIRVPLIVKPPISSDAEGNSVAELTSLVDLYPTITELTGAAAPSLTQGTVLPPFSSDGGHSYVFSEVKEHNHEPRFFAVRSPRWKYMNTDSDSLTEGLLEGIRYAYRKGKITQVLRNPLYYLRDFVLQGKDETGLYEISDRGERRVKDEKVVIAELKEQIQNWNEDCNTLSERVNHNRLRNQIDEDTVRQLEGLGYLE